MRRNTAADTDAYKQHHASAIHPGLEVQSTYGECRLGARYPETCYLGTDIIIQDNFLTVPTKADIQEAREQFVDINGYDRFDVETWEKVRNLGYYPMHIKSVAEGSVVGVGNVLFTAKSTEPWFCKTLNSLEPLMMHFWYPTTVSTRSMNIKKRLIPLVAKSGTIDNLPFMVVDFGLRGASSFESAVIGGIGHLVHFQSSDNNPASRLINDYYGYKGRSKSIFATEHSVALSFGPGQGEFDYVNHCLDQGEAFPDKPMALVIDTYDALGFVTNVIGSAEIQKRIKERPGRVILRPDSGDPKTIVEQVLERLLAIFGFSINDKGYKVLDHNVGVIQGDGMNEDSIIELYEYIISNRWSSDNLAVGSGGGLLQENITRDTQRVAIKPSVGIINGEEVMFKKSPKTDLTKSSKSGELKLYPNYDGTFTTFSSVNDTKAQFASYDDALTTSYLNGEFTGNNFKDVIERANNYVQRTTK